jgi:hypothetical protein
MNKFQKETLKLRLLKLVTLKSTGSPCELTLRFEISERSVKRIVREISIGMWSDPSSFRNSGNSSLSGFTGLFSLRFSCFPSRSSEQ